MTFTQMPFDEDKFYEAISEGVTRALLQVLRETNSRYKPSDLICQAIMEGTEKAMSKE